MSIFLTDHERDLINRAPRKAPSSQFYTALLDRTDYRAASPGTRDDRTTTDWWHHIAEYLTDAAMTHALRPSELLTAWIRETTLAVSRRPIADWVGPPFRNHKAEAPVGHLETAHLSWSLAVVLDLAPDAFTEAERDELSETLREKGIALCQRWLDQKSHLANWRCVLNAGVSVAAAVINDREAIDRATAEFARCVDIFQPDGSYSESLQYSNYAGYTLMLTREALIRKDPTLADSLPLEPWVKKPRWDVASLLYQKPLAGWGAHPRPRSANFNDSAAIHGASADFLLHLAARAGKTHPTESGLARWLFDTLYTPYISKGPLDLATFGFVNDFGFLTLPLLCQAVEAIAPQEAGLTELETFTCGDVLARDSWDGRTTLAVHGAGEALHGPGHLHGDLNSFILVHNKERLLVDPGHSCYRNITHGLEGSSLTHNTCTFTIEPSGDETELQKKLLNDYVLQQSRIIQRTIDPVTRESNPPVQRGGERLIAARHGNVTAIGSEIAPLYGEPITRFARFWFLCGTHALFVVDHIVSNRPVTTSWSWLLNNRDGELNLKIVHPDRLVARRGNAGMKIFHLGGGRIAGPLHAYMHDAYHPLPGQRGEGQAGSGKLLSWTERRAMTNRTVIHAIALDNPSLIAGWHLKTDDDTTILEGPDAEEIWQLQTASDSSQFRLSETTSGKQYYIVEEDGSWKLTTRG